MIATIPPIFAYHDLAKESRCGGGYTDKNGINWNWRGEYPNCYYSPSVDIEMLTRYKNDKFWVRNNLEAPPLPQQEINQ